MTELSQTDRVYLADADPHSLAGPTAAGDLRARIAFHSFLADHLVVGDSQSLNSPLLRLLLVADDTAANMRACALAALLRSGFLRVARRDSVDSFRPIRDGHAARDVEHVPTVAYSEWLDGV